MIVLARGLSVIGREQRAVQSKRNPLRPLSKWLEMAVAYWTLKTGT